MLDKEILISHIDTFFNSSFFEFKGVINGENKQFSPTLFVPDNINEFLIKMNIEDDKIMNIEYDDNIM